MRGFGNWMFGDIASVFAPRADRGAGNPPTRRAAHWLIGIGLFITLFGAIGVAGETSSPLERQHATIVGLYTSHFYTQAVSDRIEKVKLRLEDGSTKLIPQEPLFNAVGTRRDVPVTVDIDPDTDLVDAIYLDGRRYGTGRQSAAVVITILFTVLGVFLLLRGIGRLRRARLESAADDAEGEPLRQ